MSSFDISAVRVVLSGNMLDTKHPASAKPSGRADGRKRMNRDLTQGTPGGVIRRFSLPLFFSVIFQQLYIVVDSLVAGRFVGEAALAAVNNTYQITLLYQALAIGFAMGSSVVVSRLFGAGRKRDVASAATTALISCLALCAVLTAAGLAGATALLRLVRTPAELVHDSGLYLSIFTAGLVFLFCYQIALGIFTALGDSRTVFFFLTASSLVNILLDVLFVAKLHMGVAGVAWATFICQAAGGILSVSLVLFKLRRIKSSEQPKERYSVFSPALLKEMLRITIPVTIQQLIISFGSVLIQGNVNRFGADVSAGYAAAIKMNNLAITALMAFDRGMAAFAAQNEGANKPERIRSGLKAGIVLSVSTGLFIGAGYLIFREQIISFFLKSSNVQVLANGTQYLLLVVPFYLFVSIKIVCDGTLRGLSAMRMLLTGTFVDLALRVGCGFLFSALWGPVGIWAAWPVGWITGTALSAFFVTRLLRKKKKRVDVDTGALLL